MGCDMPINDTLKQLVKQAMELKVKDQKSLQVLKNQYSTHYKVGAPTNMELVEAYREMCKEKGVKTDSEFMKLLRKRGVRSMSGIVSITVITKAFPCPGKCIFCPTEPNMPKSYLSNEPAIMRAILNDFGAYEQTLNRIDSLQRTGHDTDKVEIIVSGGTFSFYPHAYQTAFTRQIFNALNYPLKPSRSLLEAQQLNETAENRCVGLSFETRPDHIDEKEVRRLATLGATKIEIGVQCLDDEIYALNQRGHTIADVARCMQVLKDGCFKVNAHMMPNLYGSTPERDFEMMKELFDNPDFRPDWMKIYPTMVVPWSVLDKMHKRGEFKAYSDPVLIDLMCKIKPLIPEYVRVTRLYRDIPAPTIVDGSKISNLRQVVQEEMRRRGLPQCRCIRCREVRDTVVDPKDLRMRVTEYDASGGHEFFIQWEDPVTDKICGFIRLRFPSQYYTGKKHFIKELEGCALIRELHVYGMHIPLNDREEGAQQHFGLGKTLLAKAEEISRAAGFKKMAIISGVGVREYYRKTGYKLEGTYMIKGI
ncbi:MAG: tRNA uridine(34) 5-carboxymethylaminomethyl modification radical SAM/GNAT enzyme Elp3 [Candidatus Gracilibacteria bacterium]